MEHGDRVRVTQTYKRRASYFAHRTDFTWVGKDTEATLGGVYLGTRSLCNGTFDREDGFAQAGKRFQAALVSLNARTNPVYVPLDSIFEDMT